MKKDLRINTKPVTWDSYVVMYLLMAFVCTAVLVILNAVMISGGTPT